MAVERLATLLDSGIGLADALGAGARAGGEAGTLLSGVATAVSRGRSLSQAMADIAGVTQTEAALIRAGERSGRLDRTLSLLARRMSYDAQTKNHLIHALVYPSVLVILTITIVTAMGAFVIPTFSSMYEGLGVALPITTRAVVAIGDLVTRYGLGGVLIGTVLGLATSAIVDRRPNVRALFHAQWLRLPTFGSLARATTKHELYTTLAALLEAGVELDRAISLATPAVTNLELRRRLVGVRSLIRRGWLPSAAVVRAGLDPDGHDASLLKTAEDTGRFAECCAQIAAIARSQRDERIETLSKLFEPLAIMILTCAVGLTVAGVYQPILGSAALLIGDIR
jgi:type II secretory pathway component PulF